MNAKPLCALARFPATENQASLLRFAEQPAGGLSDGATYLTKQRLEAPQKREWTPLLLQRCSWHLLICQVLSRPPGNLGMPLASQKFESNPIAPIIRAVPASTTKPSVDGRRRCNGARYRFCDWRVRR